MLKKVLETIRKHNMILPGDSVITGVSGGPDSVCLLHVLMSLSASLKIKVYAAHLNHMLRGAEAMADEEYVRYLCKKLGVELFVKSADIESMSRLLGISKEEAGREARYDFFRVLAESTGAGKIAIAHNRNDQAETVLMHIFRGTGLNGLTGMDYIRGRVIRPLLDADRSEIEKYCEDNLLNPRTDSSNLKSIFTRNRVRLEVIPQINTALHTDVTEALCRMTELLSNDNDFIENAAAELFKSCIIKCDANELKLDIVKLKPAHTALQNRVIQISIKYIKGSLKNIESIHIEQISDLLQKSRTGSEISLPEGIRAAISYKTIRFYKQENKVIIPDFEKPLKIPGITHLEEPALTEEPALIEKIALIKGPTLIIEADIIENNGDCYKSSSDTGIEKYFDYDLAGTGIYIRNRRNGDVFSPEKSNGTRKLKEYFIDMKIPRELRAAIPMIAKGNEILWIIGCRASDKYKVTGKTKKILRLRFVNGLK